MTEYHQIRRMQTIRHAGIALFLALCAMNVALTLQSLAQL